MPKPLNSDHSQNASTDDIKSAVENSASEPNHSKATAETADEKPESENDGIEIDLALSGGGFRASLFHLGVLRYLLDSGLISSVKRITSVSGGSILAAHVVLHWEDYVSTRYFDTRADELLTLIRDDLRKLILGGWFLYFMRNLTWFTTAFVGIAYLLPWLLRKFDFIDGESFLTSSSAQIFLASIGAVILVVSLIGRRSKRTKLLETLYANYLFGQDRKRSWLFRMFSRNKSPVQLKNLAVRGDAGSPQLYLATASMTDGELYSFNAAGIEQHTSSSDEREKKSISAESLPIAKGVAASSAFPPLFPPVRVSARDVQLPAAKFGETQMLTDGGVFDNTGIHLMRRLDSPQDTSKRILVVSDAGKPFVRYSGFLRFLPIRATRTADVQMKCIGEVENSKLGENDIQIRLDYEGNGKHCLPALLQRAMRTIRTDLNRFSDKEIHLLIWHGYCAANAALAEKIQTKPDQKPWSPIEGVDVDQIVAKEFSSKSSSRPLIPFGLNRPTFWIVVCFLMNLLYAGLIAATKYPKQIQTLGDTKFAVYDAHSDEQVVFQSKKLLYVLSLGYEEDAIVGWSPPFCAEAPESPTQAFVCRIETPNGFDFDGHAFLFDESNNQLLSLSIRKDSSLRVPSAYGGDSIFFVGDLVSKSNSPKAGRESLTELANQTSLTKILP
ncbi:MAG: patatin-like phospholipase family protein [Planctomycetota bacterium]